MKIIAALTEPQAIRAFRAELYVSAMIVKEPGGSKITGYGYKP
jgi:hypothetical protein